MKQPTLRRGGLVIGLATILAVVGLVSPAHGVPDSTPPELVSLSFSPTTANTGTGPAVVTVTAHITDDLSGLAGLNGVFYAPAPSSQTIGFGFNVNNRVSGTALDGIYQTTVTLPQFGATGVWSIRNGVSLSDVVGNVAQLSEADLVAAGFPTQLTVTGVPDSTPPELVSLSFSPTTANTGTGPAVVTVTAHITDDLSGLAGLNGVFYAPAPSSQTIGFGFNVNNRVSGTALDGIYQTTVTLPQFGATGVWSIRNGVSLSDVVGNVAQLSEADLVAAGFPTQLTVTGVPDSTPPELVSLSFSPTTANTGTGPAVVTVTAHITDDLSGLAGLNGVFYAPAPSSQTIGFGFNVNNRVSGTALDGIYQTTVTLPQFGATGVWSIRNGVSLSDVVGNVAQLSEADLVAAGFPTQLTVTDTPVTVPDAPTIGTATAGNGSGSVAFTAGSNGGSPVLHFDATCTSSNSGATGTGSGAVSPIAVSGLTNGDTYTCAVTATNAIGTGLPSFASNTFTPTLPAPIASALPSNGSSGTVVSVTGSGWNPTGGPVSLNFSSGGDIVGATVNGSGVLSANISVGPTEALGSNPIIVTQGSTVVSVPFTVTSGVSAPTLVLTPGQGSTGTVVSLSGQHWPTGGPLSVVFTSGTDTGAATVNASGILSGSITVGSAEPLGSDPIYVFDGATYVSAAFTVVAPSGAPTVSVDPLQGAAATTVAITGQHWNPTGGPVTVWFEFGSDAGSATVDGAGNLTGSIAVSPAEPLGANEVMIRQGSTIVGAAFTVVQPSALSPTAWTNVSQGGIGTVVTINGANWDPHGGPVSVRFTSGPDIGTATVDSSGKLTGSITVGAGETSGSNPIIITQGSTTVLLSVGVLPSGWPGTQVPVGGGGLPPGSGVTVTGPGGSACTTTVNVDGTFSCPVPISGPPGQILLTVTDGSITYTIPFTVLAPTASATPTQGSAGTAVSITGQNWNPAGGPVTVTFTHGPDSGSATVDASGNLTGAITVGSSETTGSNPIILKQGPITVSIPFTVTSIALSVPGPPHPEAAVPYGSGTAKVIWKAPANNGGSVITAYIVTPFLGGVAQPARTFTSSNTSEMVTGLQNGKVYQFEIAAKNAVGVGPVSPKTPPMTAGAPGQPGKVAATKVAAGSLKITFTAPLNDGAAITTYTATCRSSNGGATKSKAGSASPITVTGLSAGKTYTCTVTATNSRGTGPGSAKSNAATA